MKHTGRITATSIALWIAACGSVSQSDSPCPGVCRSIVERGCPADLDQSRCVTECDSRRAPSASCKGQYEALISCTSDARIECSSDGDALAIGCETESSNYQACLGTSSGTGGTAGTGGSAGSGGTTGGCGPSALLGATCEQISQGTPECNACAVANCCEQENRCYSDNDCSGLVVCMNNTCGNATDLQKCVEERCTACFNRASVALYNGIAQCLNDHCGTECY